MDKLWSLRVLNFHVKAHRHNLTHRTECHAYAQFNEHNKKNALKFVVAAAVLDQFPGCFAGHYRLNVRTVKTLSGRHDTECWRKQNRCVRQFVDSNSDQNATELNLK